MPNLLELDADSVKNDLKVEFHPTAKIISISLVFSPRCPRAISMNFSSLVTVAVRVFCDFLVVLEFFSVSWASKLSILEERSCVRSDETVVGLMVIGWVVWLVLEQRAVA